MKLILIVKGGEDATSVDLLRKAADKLDVELLLVDFREPPPDLNPREKYLLYRVTPALGSLRVERAICEKYPCISLVRFAFSHSPKIAQELAGIPTPRTEDVLDADAVSLLDKVERVGGFPLVVKDKVTGGHGIGVIKVESLESLHSIVRLIFAQGPNKSFQLQQFIPHAHHARLIVLGDQVIDSIAYNGNDYDFRTNRSQDEINVEYRKFPEAVERTAIAATRANLVEYGGVDIIDDDGDLYVLEVNNPCYFARAQLCTGYPTSERMVEYLLAKADYRPRNRWPADRPLPTLVLVNQPADRVVKDSFNKQARYLGMPVIEVDPDDAEPELPADGTYLLCRASVLGRSREIDLYRRYDCTSFAGDYPVLADPDFNRNRHYQGAGLPFIPKVPVTHREINYLKSRLEEAGRLPLLIKSWDSNKTDFARADSLQTYISLADYLLALGKSLTIQPFVDVKHYARMVVLGDEVVSSIEYVSRDPLNYGYQRFDVVFPREFPEEVRWLAVTAAKSHQLECAAVNVLVGRDNTCFVEEVLHPFFFYRDEHVSGVNLTERMLDHLLARCAEKQGLAPSAAMDAEQTLNFV
jgi:glutathione synthase/RimK-type ligase-like ATP-grasp enzyme